VAFWLTFHKFDKRVRLHSLSLWKWEFGIGEDGQEKMAENNVSEKTEYGKFCSHSRTIDWFY
jgi:ribosomal protein L33